jgi:hypothetical protein
MIQLIGQLRYQFKPNKIYADGAKPDFIKSLKIQFNEAVDYERIIDQAKRDKIKPDHRMYVIPVSFGEFGKELLGRFEHVVSKAWFCLSAVDHKAFVTQMRMCKFKDNGNLDKDDTGNDASYDLIDSTRLALKMFPLAQKI